MLRVSCRLCVKLCRSPERGRVISVLSVHSTVRISQSLQQSPHCCRWCLLQPVHNSTPHKVRKKYFLHKNTIKPALDYITLSNNTLSVHHMLPLIRFTVSVCSISHISSCEGKELREHSSRSIPLKRRQCGEILNVGVRRLGASLLWNCVGRCFHTTGTLTHSALYSEHHFPHFTSLWPWFCCTFDTLL